jgi:hypothetical protein
MTEFLCLVSERARLNLSILPNRRTLDLLFRALKLCMVAAQLTVGSLDTQAAVSK